MKKIVITLSFLLLVSCSSEIRNLTKARNAIVEYCGSEDVNVSSSYAADTNNGYTDFYEITIKNVSVINKENYPPEYLAAIAAKTLFDNLSEEERQDRDLIKVTIETPNKKLDYEYSIKALSKVDHYLTITKEFIFKLTKGDFENLNSLVNTETINSKEIEKNMVKGFTLGKDTLFKKIEIIDLRSITFTTIKNQTGTELITFGNYGNDHFEFSTRFLDNKPGKISGFSIY